MSSLRPEPISEYFFFFFFKDRDIHALRGQILSFVPFRYLQAGVAGAAVASATPSTPPPQHEAVMGLARALGGKVCSFTHTRPAFFFKMMNRFLLQLQVLTD